MQRGLGHLGFVFTGQGLLLNMDDGVQQAGVAVGSALSLDGGGDVVENGHHLAAGQAQDLVLAPAAPLLALPVKGVHPFGLARAPNAAERLQQHVLEGGRHQGADAPPDDILSAVAIHLLGGAVDIDDDEIGPVIHGAVDEAAAGHLVIEAAEARVAGAQTVDPRQPLGEVGNGGQRAVVGAPAIIEGARSDLDEHGGPVAVEQGAAVTIGLARAAAASGVAVLAGRLRVHEVGDGTAPQLVGLIAEHGGQTRIDINGVALRIHPPDPFLEGVAELAQGPFAFAQVGVGAGGVQGCSDIDGQRLGRHEIRLPKGGGAAGVQGAPALAVYLQRDRQAGRIGAAGGQRHEAGLTEGPPGQALLQWQHRRLRTVARAGKGSGNGLEDLAIAGAVVDHDDAGLEQLPGALHHGIEGLVGLQARVELVTDGQQPLVPIDLDRWAGGGNVISRLPGRGLGHGGGLLSRHRGLDRARSPPVRHGRRAGEAP